MIAEDEPVSRLVLEETLTEFGYDVTVCLDGTEAWKELSQESPPEIAVLDWMMPGMDGPDLCRMVRQSINPSSTYIILLTIKDNKSDLVEGLQAGADDYVTKPFDREELRARIRVGQRIVELQRQKVEQETSYYVQQLEQAVLSLRESRSRIVDAQEDIRKAIAEELHGNVQTRLLLLNFKAADIQEMIDAIPEEAKVELSHMTEELDDLRENEIRKLSHRLHPSVIKLSLTSATKGLCDQFKPSVQVELFISDGVKDLEPGTGSLIPDKTRLGLYRVAEEALGNIVKHANATSAAVHLWTQQGSGMICLSVEDNGRGFEQTEGQKRSLGMVTIQDYMGAIGGVFDIRSTPMEGTKVTVMAPLLSEDAEEALREEPTS